jgi:hypothetical protein
MEEQGIILSPKEKAKELVDNFYQTTPNEACLNEPLGIAEEYKAWNQSKQCALIAIDEIIDALDKSLIDSDIEWWKQVKQEIEKL